MDNTLIVKHYSIIAEKYPNMSLTQLGLVCIMLGSIRASLGHEGSLGSIEDYIHPEQLSPEIRQSLDFIEREILAIKKSKIDIDYFKMGKQGSFRRDTDLSHTV